MKKTASILFLALCTTACTELNGFLQEMQKPTQHKVEQQKNIGSTKSQYVIKVKKRPNDGKKVVKNGMEYPEQFSLDENGNLEFRPTISNRTLREWNKITEKHGITIQGY